MAIVRRLHTIADEDNFHSKARKAASTRALSVKDCEEGFEGNAKEEGTYSFDGADSKASMKPKHKTLRVSKTLNNETKLRPCQPVDSQITPQHPKDISQEGKPLCAWTNSYPTFTSDQLIPHDYSAQTNRKGEATVDDV